MEAARVVDSLAEEGGGCVLQLSEQGALRALAGPAGQSIRAMAASGRLAIVVIATSGPVPAARGEFDVVELAHPDPQAVVRAYLRHRSGSEESEERVTGVLGLLRPPVGPAAISAIVDQVIGSPDLTAPQIAAAIDASASVTAVSQWLGEGRSPHEVAALAAGVALSGAPCMVVHDQAESLAELLKLAEPAGENELIGYGSPSSDLLRTGAEKVTTHFGVQYREVVEVTEPHRPQDLIQTLWRTLGPRFRSGFGEWLSLLPESRGMGWQVAHTAGALFAIDPVLVEAQILRPWALHHEPLLRRRAGIALGAPVGMGADPEAARALAHSWATSSSPRLQHAAVAAYGGLLGAWDAASAAPLKLFRIGQLKAGLRLEADWALANLVVAGREASASRSWTLGYLKLVSEDPFLRPRAFWCLPRIASALVAPNAICVESLAALRDEPETWGTFHELLGAALVTPSGVAAGRRCLEVLVAALARDHVDRDLVHDVIQGMRNRQRPYGTVGKLGAAVRRSLAAIGRSGSDEVKNVAAALTDSFFR